ncbi:MAG: hypothetical protein HRT45_04560 [Bdellovibrionales bacterium]|nr:hypothetical protein [Bdellovibrionales bacterium]
MTVKNIKSRWIIFAMQIVAIVALLAFNQPSQAFNDNDNDNDTTQTPRRIVDNMSVPYRWRKNPPDVGFRHYENRGRDDDQYTVWVPGLTDGMDAEHKQMYYDMKKQDSAIVWNYRRKEVAAVIKYAQANPRAECRTQINNTATAVALVCRSGGETKRFPNMVASQFDHYLDDIMITPTEDAGLEIAGGQVNGGDRSGPRHFSGDGGGTTGGGQQATDRGPASSGGPNGGGGVAGPSQPGGGYGGSDGSAYSYYINSQVTPRAQNIERSSDSVFSSGNEDFIQLDDKLKSKADVKMAPSPAVRENKKKNKS